MCASYGIDPRFSGQALLDAEHEVLLDALRDWARAADEEVRRPTGRNARNLNPLLVPRGGVPKLQEAWWGHLAEGEPVRYPSINTRSERLRDRPSDLRFRAIVPATSWFEMQKPSRAWREFGMGGKTLFGMAAVIRPGRTSDGAPVTCYSIVTRDAPAHLSEAHPRMPLLIPPPFAAEWLAASASAALLDAALDASASLDEAVTAVPIPSRP